MWFLPFFWCSTPNRVLDLQKFETECRLITQDTLAQFDVTCSIPRCILWKLSRDLAVKPDGNRFRIMMGIVIKCWCNWIWRNRAKRIQNSQMFSSMNIFIHQSSIDRPSAHCNLHRTRSGTCRLVHKPSFDSTFQLSLRNLSILAALRCTCSFLVSWVRQLQTLHSGQTGFSKHKIFQQIKPLHTSEGLINTRLGSVSTQDCNVLADWTSCGQDWLTLTSKVLCFELPVGPAPMHLSAALATCCSIMIDCIREKHLEVIGRSEVEAKLELELELCHVTTEI